MRYFLLFISFTLLFQAYGQVEIENVIDTEADYIYSDNFDNLYVLSDNVLTKYSSDGKKVSSFFSEGGEDITSVDVKNPFKITLHFSNQNKIILLDNELTQISNDIYLDKLGVFGDALFCSSTAGGFWIYDAINSHLLKLKSDFSVEYRKDINISEELISITENAPNVIFQKRSREFVACNIETWNKKNLPIYKASDSYRYINNEVVYYSGNLHGLIFYNWKLSQNKHIKLPSNITIKDAVYGKTKVFFFNTDKVYIASIKED